MPKKLEKQMRALITDSTKVGVAYTGLDRIENNKKNLYSIKIAFDTFWHMEE